MTLDQLPEEVPTKEAYLSKQMIEPKLEITMLDLSECGLGEVETNKTTVQHRGIRRSIPSNDMCGPWILCQSHICERKTLESILDHVLSLQGRGTQDLGLHQTKRMLPVQSIDTHVSRLQILQQMREIWASVGRMQHPPIKRARLMLVGSYPSNRISPPKRQSNWNQQRWILTETMIRQTKGATCCG